MSVMSEWIDLSQCRFCWYCYSKETVMRQWLSRLLLKMSPRKLISITSALVGALQRKQIAIRTSIDNLGFTWQEFSVATDRSICKFFCRKLLSKKGLELECMKDLEHLIKLKQLDLVLDKQDKQCQVSYDEVFLAFPPFMLERINN